jgi:hypothetical protein
MTSIDTIASLTLQLLEPRKTRRPKYKHDDKPYKCEPRPTTVIYVGMSPSLDTSIALYLMLDSFDHHIQLCWNLCLACTSPEEEIGGITVGKG